MKRSAKVAFGWVELCPSLKTPEALRQKRFENITGASINARTSRDFEENF